jgi:hypothetical protein
MFTWICQVCGREVPPSYSECPTCAERNKALGGQAPTQPSPAQASYSPGPSAPVIPPPYAPPAPQPAPPAYHPPQPPPPQQQQWQPPYSQQPPAANQGFVPPPSYIQQQPQQPTYVIGGENHGKKKVPSWVAALIVFALIGGALFGLYRWQEGESSPATEKTALEPPTSRSAPAGAHPFTKQLELAGLRIAEGTNKKLALKFVVINHSMAEMDDLALKIDLTSTAAKEGDPPIASVDAKVGTLGILEVKDFEVPIETKMRVYELPDWQFLKASFTITSPKS